MPDFRAGERTFALITQVAGRAGRYLKNGKVIVRQGNYNLTAKRLDTPGHPLQTQVCGAMSRAIYEHPSCNAYYRFEENLKTCVYSDYITFSTACHFLVPASFPCQSARFAATVHLFV